MRAGSGGKPIKIPRSRKGDLLMVLLMLLLLLLVRRRRTRLKFEIEL
jgi:hypothetical protein